MSRKKTRRRERSKKLRVTTKVRSTGKEDQKQHGKRRNEKKAKKIEKRGTLISQRELAKNGAEKEGSCNRALWVLPLGATFVFLSERKQLRWAIALVIHGECNDTTIIIIINTLMK